MENAWVKKSKKKSKEELLGHMVKDILGLDAQDKVKKLIVNQFDFQAQSDGQNEDWLTQMFRRISIFAVRRLYDPENLPISELISLQPLESPCGVIKNSQWELGENSELIVQTKELAVAAKCRMLKTCLPVFQCSTRKDDWMSYGNSNIYFTPEYIDYVGGREALRLLTQGLGLTNECEMADYIFHSLANEITAEIINDIRNNVGTSTAKSIAKYNVQDSGELSSNAVYQAVLDMGSIIHQKTKHGGRNRWIIASPELLKRYFNLVNEDFMGKSKLDLRMFLGWCGYSIYCYKHMPENEILVGCGGGKPYQNGGQPFMAGYIYSPYVPLMLLPPVCLECRGPDAVHTDEHETRQKVMTRYAKTLPTGGHKFFGKIAIYEA